jgi:hypothetical protein
MATCPGGTGRLRGTVQGYPSRKWLIRFRSRPGNLPLECRTGLALARHVGAAGHACGVGFVAVGPAPGSSLVEAEDCGGAVFGVVSVVVQMCVGVLSVVLLGHGGVGRRFVVVVGSGGVVSLTRCGCGS